MALSPSSGLPLRTARVVWAPGDQRWTVARDWLARTAYASVSDLAEAIARANPAVADWTRVAPGSVVLLPLGQ